MTINSLLFLTANSMSLKSDCAITVILPGKRVTTKVMIFYDAVLVQIWQSFRLS
jgi:hypothetical protein